MRPGSPDRPGDATACRARPGRPVRSPGTVTWGVSPRLLQTWLGVPRLSIWRMHVSTPRRAIAGLVSTMGACVALSGCGSDADTLTVYSAQHESLVRTMLEDFTEETGIELEFRDANDSELANQIVEEGEASPADVFLTENSPAIDVVDEAGLLLPPGAAPLQQGGDPSPPSSGTPG